MLFKVVVYQSCCLSEGLYFRVVGVYKVKVYELEFRFYCKIYWRACNQAVSVSLYSGTKISFLFR